MVETELRPLELARERSVGAVEAAEFRNSLVPCPLLMSPASAYASGVSEIKSRSGGSTSTLLWREGWYCQFLEEDLKTPLPRKVVLPNSAKLIELAQRGGYVLNLENRQATEHAIANGRGSVWLELTPDQYAKLWESSEPKRG
jgi:hypothetical protein